MDITEKLGLWGITHARARTLERAAQHPDTANEELQRAARHVRLHADQLHREIYNEMGRKAEQPR